MLRNRVITALILAPLVLAAVFYLPPLGFAIFFWVVAALGVYEWAGLLKIEQVWKRVSFVGVYAVLALMVYQVPQHYANILTLTCLLWVFAAIAVLRFPRDIELFRQPWLVAIVGLTIATGAWVSLMVIRAHDQGSLWLLWILVLVWGADVGAYFAGRAFGRRALAPAVSPGKTWEGVIGGGVLAGLVCGGAIILWQANIWFWLGLTVVLIAVSVFGDLFESLLKRTTGIKDSGTLLPGHGGVLDRIDSILAVLPVLAIILI